MAELTIGAVARQAGWIPETARFEHAQIGNVLGTDGKILRTRSGDSIKLSALLQEGVDRARGILDELEASAQFDEATLASIAEAVGIGAVKYADLSTARDSEYVDMFLDEARLAARLHHSNLVQVYDIGEADGLPFYAMEYLDGHDVRAMVRVAAAKKERMPPRPSSAASAAWSPSAPTPS